MNDFTTGWFSTPFGVKQGDVLSPTLFAIFVNDLVQEIKNSGLGVMLDDVVVSCLLYADDIVLLAESGDALQKMLNIVTFWCSKWRLMINQNKTQIMDWNYGKEGTVRSLLI